MRIERREPRARRGDARRAADAVVPQHVVVGRRRAAAAASSATARRSWSPTTALAGYRLEAAPGPDGAPPEALFCENETNAPRVFGVGADHAVPEGRHQRPRRLRRRHGQPGRVRHQGRAALPGDRAGRRHGRAAAAAAPPGRAARRRTPTGPAAAFDDDRRRARGGRRRVLRARSRRPAPTPEQMRVLRQACAGLVWSKQMYPYNVRRWLDGDPGAAAAAARRTGTAATPAGGTSTRSTCSRCRTRGSTRGSPPGTSAFHTIPWAHLDPAFAKYQLLVLLREWFQHPNGALPAYEWNFDDVNPPVHVLAALRVFVIDGGTRPRVPRAGLPEAAASTSPGGSTARTPTATTSSAAASSASTTSARSTARTCPTGVALEQADGTAWMAYYALVDARDRDRARRGERRLLTTW